LHEGERSITVDAPPGVTPLFVRAGSVLFFAEPGRNAQETLGGPLAVEVTPPESGCAGQGSLFLDDGESDASARFLLDATVDWEDRALLVRFERREFSYWPEQREFVLRVPATFRLARVDGRRAELRKLDLAGEGRDAARVGLRVPLGTRVVTFE
jgi:hypothetical protein